MHAWLTGKRCQVPNESAIVKAIDDALKRWGPLIRFLEDLRIPVDSNPLEKRIRSAALVRRNWLFAGNLPSGPPARSCSYEPDSVFQTQRT